MIENARFRSAINRIYYGMFYSLLTLGLAHQSETSKHAQLIGWFNKKFINGGILNEKYGKIINRAFNHRTKGDYDSFVEFDQEIVLAMFEEMQEFISAIEDFFKDGTYSSKGFLKK